MQQERENTVIPAKRKLEDRGLRSDELEKTDLPPVPSEGVNGGHAPLIAVAQASRSSISPVMQRKKRVRYSDPPIWGTKHANNRRLNAPNFVLHHKVVHNHHAQINGRQDAFVKPERTSRHASPDEKRSAAPSHPPPPDQAAPGPPNADGPLGPWEPSITGQKPLEELAKNVADFLYLNVVANPDMGEITSRGVQFEIEAKLGTLISKDTNGRVSLPVATECILQDNGRIAFRSSMTEVRCNSLFRSTLDKKHVTKFFLATDRANIEPSTSSSTSWSKPRIETTKPTKNLGRVLEST
jgi:hypothetical protein